MDNHASVHMKWEPSQNLKIFLAEACQDDKQHLEARQPNIIDIIEGGTIITLSLSTTLGMIMRMFAETHGKDNYYLCKVESLPALAPAIILEMVNCNWCSRSLDEDPSSLKSVLTFLNFCGLPTNQVDYKQHVSMETMLAISLREDQLGQQVEHSKPKTMDSFIRVRQIALEDFTTILVNLCFGCIHVLRHQLKSNHNPLIR